MTITNDSSFAPATLELMAQVATVESSYEQFSSEKLYTQTALWPRESGKPGTRAAGRHIGLMQVQIADLGTNQATPTALADAWDWLQNTQDGVQLPSQNSIAEKLNNAYNKYANSTILAEHPGLPPLTSCQLEEMALELYGPSPKNAASDQYYVIQKVNGSWQWTINRLNPCGVCYVIKIRNATPLSGGSASSCPATPTIPADPPTNYYYDCTTCK